MIDLETARDANEYQELSKIVHILSSDDPADSFTKIGKYVALLDSFLPSNADLPVRQSFICAKSDLRHSEEDECPSNSL